MAGRCYKALAEGESDPAALAARAHHTLHAYPEQLCDALGACAELNPVYRQLLKMSLKELQLMEEQIDQQLTSLLEERHQTVHRLAEVPGLGGDSGQQIIAQIGATAAPFPSAAIWPRG